MRSRGAVVLTLFLGACSAFGADDEDGRENAPLPPSAADGGSAVDAADGSATGDAAAEAGSAVFAVPCSEGEACTSPDQVCCNYACKAASTCSSSTVFQCNDADDCAAAGKPGMLCCMNRTNSVVNSTACRTACAGGEDRACNLAGDDRQCPDGQHCVNELSTNGYGLCQ